MGGREQSLLLLMGWRRKPRRAATIPLLHTLTLGGRAARAASASAALQTAACLSGRARRRGGARGRASRRCRQRPCTRPSGAAAAVTAARRAALGARRSPSPLPPLLHPMPQRPLLGLAPPPAPFVVPFDTSIASARTNRSIGRGGNGRETRRKGVGSSLIYRSCRPRPSSFCFSAR